MKKALICMLQLHKNSGSARTAYENIRYFKSRGYEVHVAAMTMDKEALKCEAITAHKLYPFVKSTGLMRRKWFNWQIQNLRQKLKPDITLGHGDIQSQDFLTLHNCVFLASELIHGKALDPKSEMAITHSSILKNHNFKKMIANSQFMKADLMERFHVPENKIEVVYPSLDIKTFFPQTDALKEKLKSRFGFPNKVVVSLVTSGNFKKRGLDLYIEAIKQLSDDVKLKADFRVLGHDENGKYKNDPVTFDPCLPDIENYYNAIDVYVLPARIEEFGRVVLEAMGCGLPVITTDKVGAGELLEEESREYIIPSNNVALLSTALENLVNDKELRMRLSKINFKSAQLASEDKLYLKFDKVFQ